MRIRRYRRLRLRFSQNELRNSNAARLHDYEAAVERFRALGKQLHDSLGERRPSRRRVADENDARTALGGSKDKLPEVLVFGEQQAALGRGKLDDFLVLDARHPFRDRDHVMPSDARTDYDCKITALVGEQSHELRRRSAGCRQKDFFVSERVRGVPQCRLNIGCGQLGIRLK